MSTRRWSLSICSNPFDMKVDWKWFAMLMMTLAIIALCHRQCGHERDNTQVTTVTRIDTLRVRDTVLSPSPYRVDYPVTLPEAIDTEAVISDYFSRKSYAIRYEDTAITAVTDVTVSGNSVEMAKLDYELLRKNTVTTKTVFKEPELAVTIGGGITYNIPDKKAGFELLVGVNVKRSQFQVGYDFVNRTPRVGWQYQIFRH